MNRENLLKYFYSTLLVMIILIGVLLRLKGLLTNPSMWHDECALAWNIKFKSYSELFGILRFLQVAPPFLLVVTKLLTKIFGFSEMVFRFIPFITGCLTIIGFYFLASKTLKAETTTLWATFFIAINPILISYSFEFKPYGSDVLFTIICLFFFINLDINKLNLKKIILYGFLISIIPWFSFISIFIIAGGLLNLFIQINKSYLLKEYFLKKTALSLPIIISVLIYLKVYLSNNYTGTHMVSDWQNYFVTLNPSYFIYLLAKSIRYLFFPIQYVLFSLILIIWGIKLYAQEKSSFLNISAISFILLIIASFFHLYPFYNRLILFLIPIFLLLIIKPLDLASFDKKFKLFIILFLLFFTLGPQIISTYKYIHIQHISRGENPREMMDFMAKSLKPNDVVFVNHTSNTEFAYYSSFYKIKNKVIQEVVPNNDGEKYLEFLNALKSGYYWFYLPYDSPYTPVFQYILPWAKTKKIIYSYRNNKSVLMYIYVK